MGEEVRMSEYEANGGDDDRIGDWEIGLPTTADLTPLSQLLIPLQLASAFSILPEPHRTLLDVNRALETTLSNMRVGGGQLNTLSSNIFKSYNNNNDGRPIVVEAEEEEEEEENTERDRDPSRKLRRIDSEEANSLLRTENSVDDPSANGAAARTMKRPRLLWTPQLHKRFVDVVGFLGIKNAVPKTIMQLMNVEGLTRENVASHLQKYRLYLKRMQGLSSEGPSSSDHLFASTPVPQSMHVTGTGTGGGGGNGGGGGSVAVISSSGAGNGQLGMPIAVQYHGMMPIQMYGHMENNQNHGFDGGNDYVPYNWSGNYGSVVSYPHPPPPPHHHRVVPPNDHM